MCPTILQPSLLGWCRWGRSSAAASQRSCRSPSNARASTTLKTITGKMYPLLLDHYLDHVTPRCDFRSFTGLMGLIVCEQLDIECMDLMSLTVPRFYWEKVVEMKVDNSWIAGYHAWNFYTQSQPLAAFIMLYSQRNPVFEVDVQLHSNTHWAGSTFTSWLHNPLPTTWICMLSHRQCHIIRGGLHWSVFWLSGIINKILKY